MIETGPPAPEPPNTTTVVLRGFWHLDVGTAAETGGDGTPSSLPIELARFAARVTAP